MIPGGNWSGSCILVFRSLSLSRKSVTRLSLTGPFFSQTGTGLKTTGDGGSSRRMKQRIRNSRLWAGALGVVRIHLEAGFKCWTKTLCIPFDVLFLLQYSHMWVREQLHESQLGSWQKDAKR